MDIRELVGQVMNKSVTEYLSEVSEGLIQIPRLYPPATAGQLVALEQRAGQSLEPHYRSFLLLTDGMDGFHLDMPLFGCHDWDEGERAVDGLAFLEGVREDGTAEDVGLPLDVGLFPVSVDADRCRAIFMLERPEVLPERFWWVGEGSSSFFGNFADLLGYAIDSSSYSPREEVN
ncbi:SMI1/KNR4 family protein [Streptomyces sp. ID05-47C]|uniref:SMI1/KNR4 family protein n=1 Tax=Streptomyces sp. ID05-47C TaxID=3028665 RepID=UPI0029ADA6F0|nr:SMI1/KNR4 family protein [Streptomyces sp. ID05-47C]MDX3574856.1 SMI1/KNR4 family protein [Streptomyces sp. ID05-47C]